MRLIIAQAVGFVGMALVFIAFQQNDRKKILLVQSVAAVTFVIHFMMLGGYTGAMMNAVEIARNLIFRKNLSPKGKTISRWTFIALFAALGLMTWQNVFSLMPILAMGLSTYVFGMDKEKMIRRLSLPVSLLWLTYNVVTRSIPTVATEVFNITSVVIAMWRFDWRAAPPSSPSPLPPEGTTAR
ncbi:hypothetical protein AGMMS49992_19980 [Clostridia bacterium]|nr:hypothetical protein AGMMS49992_19980 [Clostridia bacterium]